MRGVVICAAALGAAIVMGVSTCSAAGMLGCSPPFGRLGQRLPAGVSQPFDSFETITICSQPAAVGVPIRGVLCEVTVGDEFTSRSWGCSTGLCASNGTFSHLTTSVLPGQPPVYRVCALYQNRGALPGTAYLNLITGRIPY